MDYTRPPQRLPWRDKREHEKAVALYRHGLSTSQIAERFGVAPDAVVRVLRAAGVDLVIGRQRYDGSGPGRVRIYGTGRTESYRRS